VISSNDIHQPYYICAWDFTNADVILSTTSTELLNSGEINADKP
jgi:hypothetical protein